MTDERIVGADRVLAVLIELAGHPEGVTLDELAAQMASSKSTVHRALAALRRAGLAQQQGRGLYALGDEFVRLAFDYHSARPESVLIEPVLARLTDTFGETSHYAVLDGSEVVYRAKTEPLSGGVRLTSSVGGRNPAWRTAVGKLLLSYRVQDRQQLEALLPDGGLQPRTPRSITSVDALWEELQVTRERGYAIDDQENEIGINCLAVPVRWREGGPISGAVSISALQFRMPVSHLVRDIDIIREIVPHGGPATRTEKAQTP